jgi:hypothetical protein
MEFRSRGSSDAYPFEIRGAIRDSETVERVALAYFEWVHKLTPGQIHLDGYLQKVTQLSASANTPYGSAGFVLRGSTVAGAMITVRGNAVDEAVKDLARFIAEHAGLTELQIQVGDMDRKFAVVEAVTV